MESPVSILKREMDNQGVTAYRLSKISGVSASTIGRILKGEVDPNATTIDTLLGHLDRHSTSPQSPGKPSPSGQENSEYDSDPKVSLNGIPFWDTDFFRPGSTFAEFVQNKTPTRFISTDDFEGCLAFRANTDAMGSSIPKGSTIFVAEVPLWMYDLEYGQIYWIVKKDNRKYLRYVKKFGPDPDKFLLLQSDNPRYDDIELRRDTIDSVWLVHGYLSRIV